MLLTCMAYQNLRWATMVQLCGTLLVDPVGETPLNEGAFW